MKPSPSVLARAIALASLTTIVTAGLAQGWIMSAMIAPADGAETLSRIAADTGLYRLGIVLFAVEMVAQAVMFGLWYRLMRPVSGILAVIAVVLGVVGTAIKTGSRVGLLLPLSMANDALLTDGFSDAQRGEIVTAAVAAADLGAGIGLIFLGGSTLVFAIAMYRTRIVPRAVSVLVGVPSAAWMLFADPVTGVALFMPISLLALVGALTLVVRFLGWGVSSKAWERASEGLSPRGPQA